MNNKNMFPSPFPLCLFLAETPIEEFAPTPAFPALQYLESVDQGGVAWRAGLRTGDFLIEVTGVLQCVASLDLCYRYTHCHHPSVCRWTALTWWRWVTVRWSLWSVRVEVDCWWRSFLFPENLNPTWSGRKVQLLSIYLFIILLLFIHSLTSAAPFIYR